MNNFSRLWSIGAVLDCLAPGSGVIRAGVYSGPGCESSIMEVVRSVDSGLVGLYLKSASKEEDTSSGGGVMRKAGGQGKATQDSADYWVV